MLLLSSDVHRKALLKVLKETCVPISSTEFAFEGMVSIVLATNQISFMDDELPLEGREHTLPMHIIVKCEDMIGPKCLPNVHLRAFECGYLSYPPYHHDH